MRKTSTKTKYILMLLSFLFIVSLGTGIFFLLKQKTLKIFEKRINRYSEVFDWCNHTLNDNKLDINCSGLLKDIKVTENKETCFEIQVIAQDKQLKDMTVCENEDNYVYTNDVLEFKRLMPVSIVFAYTNEGVLGEYQLNKVSFSKKDNTYIQNIINEDIANLVTIDLSTTTIQNSVDFCPQLETLPSYITEANKNAYSEYLNKNTLTEDKYIDPLLYSWDDTIIRLLYACDSSKNMGYKGVCSDKKINNLSLMSTEINHIYATPVWNNTLNNKNKMLLKEISLLYDNMYSINIPNSLVNLSLMKDLVDTVNTDSNLNGEILCGIYKIYSGLATQDSKYISDRNTLRDLFSSDLSNTSTCTDIIPDLNLNKDTNGIYIERYYSNLQPDLLTIYSRCQNLTNIVLY